MSSACQCLSDAAQHYRHFHYLFDSDLLNAEEATGITKGRLVVRERCTAHAHVRARSVIEKKIIVQQFQLDSFLDLSQSLIIIQIYMFVKMGGPAQQCISSGDGKYPNLPTSSALIG